MFAAVVIASIALLDGSMDRALRRTLKSTSSLNDEDYRGDPWRLRRDVQKDIGKGAQFVVRAPVRFIRSAEHCRCWRELTWLASGMATKVGLCVALYDAAGPTGEGSAA